MRIYLDTSVILAWFLEGDQTLDGIPPDATVASSRILWVEFGRVLERTIRTGQVNPEESVEIRRGFDATMSGVDRLRLTDSILRRAEGSFPLVIRTLDALHLSSAVAWLGTDDPSTMSIWTFDRQFNLCAAALGFITPFLEKSR